MFLIDYLCFNLVISASMGLPLCSICAFSLLDWLVMGRPLFDVESSLFSVLPILLCVVPFARFVLACARRRPHQWARWRGTAIPHARELQRSPLFFNHSQGAGWDWGRTMGDVLVVDR